MKRALSASKRPLMAYSQPGALFHNSLGLYEDSINLIRTTDMGAAVAKALGTHRASLEGLPATNRFVVVHCIFYCELQHELLLRVRAFFDVYDAATQLGILPGRGTLGEKALLMLRGFGLRTTRNP